MDYEKLMAQARAYAKRMKCPQDADDFAQYHALNAFSHGRPLKLQWSLASFLRETYGDIRTEYRRLALANTFSLDDESFEDGSDLMHEQIAAPGMTAEPFKMTLMPRTRRERSMLMMRLDGYTKEEIGRRFSITGGRVGQILKRMYASAEDYEIAMMICPQGCKEFVSKWFTGKLLVGRKYVRFDSASASNRRGKARLYRSTVSVER